MARNEEKAQSMLGRYLRSKKEASAISQKRPYLSTLCDDVDEAEKWRLQILSDVRRLASEIQNPGLEEGRVRELNDSINKLLRERGHWERRIRFLGGKDYGRRRLGAYNGEVIEYNGHFYFGEAKNLPGVKELLAAKEEKRKQEIELSKLQKKVAEMHKHVDEEYFGNLDTEDEQLGKVEEKAEGEARANLVAKWEAECSATKDEVWNDSYVQFIGNGPADEAVAEQEMMALMLEKKKREALEQLRMGASTAQAKRDDSKGK